MTRKCPLGVDGTQARTPHKGQPRRYRASPAAFLAAAAAFSALAEVPIADGYSALAAEAIATSASTRAASSTGALASAKEDVIFNFPYVPQQRYSKAFNESKPGSQQVLQRVLVSATLIVTGILFSITMLTHGQDNKSEGTQLIFIGAICSAIIVIAPMETAMNAFIVRTMKFDYPLIVSTIGFTLCAVLTHFAVLTGHLVISPEAERAILGWRWFVVVLPLSAMMSTYVTMAVFSSRSEYMGSSYGWLAGTAMTLVLFSLKLFRRPMPAWSAIWCMAIMIIGCVLSAIESSSDQSSIGVISFIMCAMSIAFLLVMMEVLMSEQGVSAVEGLHIISPASAIGLALVAFVFEQPRANAILETMTKQPINIVVICVTGCMGMLIFYLKLLLLQASSAEFVTVFHVVRLAIFSSVGVVFFGEACTWLRAGAYIVMFGGLMAYAWVRSSPSASKHLEEAVFKRLPWMSEPPLLPLRTSVTTYSAGTSGASQEGAIFEHTATTYSMVPRATMQSIRKESSYKA